MKIESALCQILLEDCKTSLLTKQNLEEKRCEDFAIIISLQSYDTFWKFGSYFC